MGWEKKRGTGERRDDKEGKVNEGEKEMERREGMGR